MAGKKMVSLDSRMKDTNDIIALRPTSIHTSQNNRSECNFLSHYYRPGELYRQEKLVDSLDQPASR